MSVTWRNAIKKGKNLEGFAELDQIRFALIHLVLCQRLLSLSEALPLVGHKVAEASNEAIGRLYSRQFSKSSRRDTRYSIHTFVGAGVLPVTVPGVGARGAASEALATSSVAGLVATGGTAGPGEEGVAVPLVVVFLRAPGGTYALALRTTAEYLRKVSLPTCGQFLVFTSLPRQHRRQGLHSSGAPPQYGNCWLPTSIILVSETPAEPGPHNSPD